MRTLGKGNLKILRSRKHSRINTPFLDGSKLFLKPWLVTFEKFGKISSLKMNNSKTEPMWIGKSKDRTV